MNIVKKIFRKILIVFENLIVGLVGIFIRRDKEIIIIGAWMGTKFADNSRSLYQYLFEHKEQLKLKKVIWVTRNEELNQSLNDMGYESYICGTKKSRYWHLKSGVHIICNAAYEVMGMQPDIDTKYSFGAIKINLWHGTGGLKAVGFSANLYRNHNGKGVQKAKNIISGNALLRSLCSLGAWENCYMIATAAIQVKTLCINFGLPASKCIITSYPRNCPCPRLLPKEDAIMKQIHSHRHVVLYLPTFRTNSNFTFSRLAEEMGELLCEHDILWIEKAHSVDIANQGNEKCNKYILRLAPEFDINVLLPHITMLITDYSSVRMDAMYHKKATLFYVPDFEEYKNGDNGFMANPNEVMCGPLLYTAEQLREAIGMYCDEPEKSKTSNYEQIRRKYWSEDKNFAEIWDDIRKAVM